MEFSAKPRARQDIEILRILSAFGIVWFHTGRDTYSVGNGGLVVFLVLSTYFAASRTGDIRPWKAALLDRARRLLAPWAFWMVVFGIRNEYFVNRHVIETDRGWINGLLAGTSIHLWYLPYIFIVLLLLDLVATRWNKRRAAWASGLLAAIGLAFSLHWRPWVEQYGYPTIQYLHAFPAVLLGIFLAGAWDLGLVWMVVILSAVLGAADYALWKNVRGVGTTYLAGIAVVSVVVLFPLRLPRWRSIELISGCAFGIYLCHPLYRGLYASIQAVPVWAEVWLTFGSSLASVLVARLLFPKVVSWVC